MTKISHLKANRLMREVIAANPATPDLSGSVDMDVTKAYPENMVFQVERPHPSKPTRIASRWFFTDEDGEMTEERIIKSINDHIVAINDLHVTEGSWV